jgi:hypothetical protein
LDTSWRVRSSPRSSTLFGERLGHARQKLVGNFLVDEQRFDGVADAGTLAFGVDDDILRHVEIGIAVDVHVAHALVVFDDGDARFFRDGANQPFPAARDAEVDQVIELQQLVDGGAVRGGHDRDAVRGRPGTFIASAMARLL